MELMRDRNSDAGASVCYSECAHIFPGPELTNAKISGNNAADKVYFFLIYLDVFLLIYHHLDVAS